MCPRGRHDGRTPVGPAEGTLYYPLRTAPAGSAGVKLPLARTLADDSAAAPHCCSRSRADLQEFLGVSDLFFYRRGRSFTSWAAGISNSLHKESPRTRLEECQAAPFVAGSCLPGPPIGCAHRAGEVARTHTAPLRGRGCLAIRAPPPCCRRAGPSVTGEAAGERGSPVAWLARLSLPDPYEIRAPVGASSSAACVARENAAAAMSLILAALTDFCRLVLISGQYFCRWKVLYGLGLRIA